MTRIFTTLLFILIPFFLLAQTVEPVISKEYLQLISAGARLHDSTYSVRKNLLPIDGYYFEGMPVKSIRSVNGKIRIVRNNNYRLAIGGSLNATVELKTINRLPPLQHQFVQGRSLNGELAYQGPETNEVFSYGPALQPGAPAYHTSVFRTASMLSQAFNLQADLIRNGMPYWTFDIKMGQSKEQTFIRENENGSKNMAVTLSGFFNGMKISGSYNYLDTRFTNSNRNGFLNRVYQNSLLTPVSFGAPYSSYSDLADNPNFLLQNSGNNYFQQQRNTSLVLSKKTDQWEYKLTQSYEKVQQASLEGYKPGTAYFPNGISFQRDKNDANYFLNANVVYRIDYDDRHFDSEITANYTFNENHSNINAYNYQRTAQQASLNFFTKYNYENLDAGVNVANRFHLSNTLVKNKYFAPSVQLHTQLWNSPRNFSFRATAGYNQFYSELPVSQSLSAANLLQYSTDEVFQYFPVKEVNGYDQLLPIAHREFTGGLTITYKYKFSLSGEVFIRNIQDDLFPVYENGTLQLKNIADHRKRGIELQLQLLETYFLDKRFSTSNRLTFFAYDDRVTQVAAGYDHTPIAGFSNVHKAVIKGQVLGAIVGNTYQKDAQQQMIIGPEGFPLANDELSVIGNPIPDFVVKMGNDLRWKKFTFGIDWEWKKGGDIWNGTEAALDYYGRSQYSGAARNTKNYIFPGVTTDGHVNTKPVDFYNPALPVEQNRWARYGVSGVAEAYMQKADHLRINSMQLSWQLPFKNTKYMQKLTLSTYVSNLMLWTAYKGVDPNQVMYDQPNTAGLDFFNLPSTKTYGFNVLLQF